MEKKVVELFAGVGGFRCGLNNVKLINNKVKENNHWEFVWANQWEPATKTQDAFDCYIKRFGSSESHSNMDITKVDKHSIPGHTLLVGGFPCQDYSVARSLSQEKGIEGKKGVLWWDIADTIIAKKPPFVLLENVDRLLISPSKQRGRDFGIMLRTFADNGYDVQWRIVNAGDYGMPQKRRRLFIFAYHSSTKYYKEISNYSNKDIVSNYGLFPKKFKIKRNFEELEKIDISNKKYADLIEVSNNFSGQFYNAGIMHDGIAYTAKVKPRVNKVKTLGNILTQDNVDSKYFIKINDFERWQYLKGAKRVPRVGLNGFQYIYSEGSMPFPDKLDSPARTMLTSESSFNRSTHVVEDFQTKNLRLIIPVEAERINGFPDNWTNTGMTDKRRYFMMGNALVVGIIKKLGRELENIIDNE